LRSVPGCASTFDSLDARHLEPARVAERVARVVFNGGTVIFPLDTSYTIACDPYRSEAIDRIYAGRKRADEKPLTLLVASPAEFLEYAHDNSLAILAAKRLLPGPIILIVRKPSFISHELAAGLRTLGFRVPDDLLARAILERCGPLAGITANPSTLPRYRGGEETAMLPPADLLIENGPTRFDRESTIVDLSGTHARLLRDGALPYDTLVERLGPVERPAVKIRTQR
jgi:L-threonylcarbamoyladenylate synthase